MPYAGQLAELPGGQGTLTSDNNAARARFLDLIVAEGIVSNKGVWEREPGAVQYTTGSLGTNVVRFSFPPRAGGAAAIFASFRLLGAFESLGQLATWSGLSGTIIALPSAAIPSGAAIVVTMTRSSALGATNVTDDAGNTYTKIGSLTFNAGAATTEFWLALSVATLAVGQRVLIDLNGAGITVGAVSAFNGLSAVDQVVTNSAAPAATALNQVTPFVLADTSEAVIVAYGDISNAGSVTTVPSSLDTFAPVAFGVGVKTAYGSLPFASVAANVLLDYWPALTTQRLLALGTDGVAYKSSGADFSALTMATTMGDQPGSMIVQGGQETAGAPRKAFFFDNGAHRIQTLSGDGVSTTDFGNGWNTTTNIPIDWATNAPRGAVIHKERLWPWSPANAPHNIYASKIRDHENFKNSVGGTFEYVQEIGTGTGLRIASAFSFKGMLFVCKYPRGIWYLDDTDVDYLNWRWNLVSDAVGVADSPYSTIVLDDDVLLVDSAGHIHFLSAIQQQGVRTSDLTAALNLQQWTRDNVNLNRLSAMSSVWYPEYKLAMLGFSSVGSTTNDLRMFLDFSNADQDGQTVRISYSHRDANRALAIRRDTTIDGVQRPILGDDDGLIWKMAQASKIKVGVPNAGQGRYQYNPTDFSHLDPSLANKRKLFDAMTVVFNPVGSWNLSVDTVIDGAYHETLYFSMGGGASVLGTFAFGERLGGGTITTNRRRMTGHGYWLSIAGYVQGDGHDFSIAKHIINMRLGGEEQR